MGRWQIFRLNEPALVVIFSQGPIWAPMKEEIVMTWSSPVIVEVCVGMEVTSYDSAEI
jgi:coenzyme PQQ precursor peptide PqqA